jgi:5-methyltetrahydropteroyltriglutamate--homocysteine methyltransferase
MIREPQNERPGAAMLLPTTVVGSYPQPGWLIDRTSLDSRVPRIRAPEIWRVPPELLAEAQNDATRIAICDMENAGIDIVTDGEIRRESYSNHFATALDGIDVDTPGAIVNRIGKRALVPRIVGPITRRAPVEVDALRFLRAHTSKLTKVTLPGPFTMAQQAQDDFYGDPEAAAFAFAAAVNAELLDLKAAGADVVQLDEPWLEARRPEAERFGIAAVDRALAGVDGETVVHVCFGYAAAVKDKPAGYGFLTRLRECSATQISLEAAQPRLDLEVLERLGGKGIVLGVLDLGTPEVETPQVVAARVRDALQRIEAERLVLAPDCGMKYLPRDVAFGKLRALADGVRIVRTELAG